MVYYYIHKIYNDILTLKSIQPTIMTSTPTVSHNEKRRPRSLNCRNYSSPYTEIELKKIQTKNYIITDDEKRSPLGKRVSYAITNNQSLERVEDIHFCSIIKDKVLVE